MEPLALPPIQPTLRKEEGRTLIFDLIRKKYVQLTPEEWVRQHMLHYLIYTLRYPRALFRVEAGFTRNQRHKRFDILVYDRSMQPWLLVECKAPALKLTQKAFNQIAVYNMALGARYLAVTNGRVHFCCVAATADQEAEYLPEFPPFPQESTSFTSV